MQKLVGFTVAAAVAFVLYALLTYVWADNGRSVSGVLVQAAVFTAIWSVLMGIGSWVSSRSRRAALRRREDSQV